MIFGRWELLLRAVLTGGIAIVSVVGDYGLKYERTALLRALIDNFTHASVGGLTWALILRLSKKSLVQELPSIILCFCLSSLVDVDHFLSARSWKLDDATHLQKRPFLHCTTVPIVVWFLLILSSNIFHYPKLGYYSWMICASFLSHHIRDGTRRGLWFYPFGSTKPIPYYLYISLCMILPYILHLCMTASNSFKIQENILKVDIV